MIVQHLRTVHHVRTVQHVKTIQQCEDCEFTDELRGCVPQQTIPRPPFCKHVHLIREEAETCAHDLGGTGDTCSLVGRKRRYVP